MATGDVVRDVMARFEIPCRTLGTAPCSSETVLPRQGSAAVPRDALRSWLGRRRPSEDACRVLPDLATWEDWVAGSSWSWRTPRCSS